MFFELFTNVNFYEKEFENSYSHFSIFAWYTVTCNNNRVFKCLFLQRSRNEVDVMVGVTAGELRDFQVKNKLQLPTNVILDTVTMVGVISAGCHVSSEPDQYVLYTCVMLSQLMYQLIFVWHIHFLQFYLLHILYLIWFVNCEFYGNNEANLIQFGYDYKCSNFCIFSQSP